MKIVICGLGYVGLTTAVCLLRSTVPPCATDDAFLPSLTDIAGSPPDERYGDA